MKRKVMANAQFWKLGFSAMMCFTFLTSFKFDKSEYKELFSNIHLDTGSYDYIYLMHFDFCSPVTKCSDTLEMKAFFDHPNKKVALIVDTLYSASIPEYIDQTKTDIYYAERVWLKRKGIYTEHQQRLIISSKGNLKRRILLK